MIRISPKKGHAYGRALHRAMRKHLAKLQIQREQALHRRAGKRYRSCARKSRYMTLHEAELNRERQQRQGKVTLYVYPCEFCQGFHLSKSPPKEGL